MNLVSPEFAFQLQFQGFLNCFSPEECSSYFGRKIPQDSLWSNQRKTDGNFAKSFVSSIQKKNQTNVSSLKISEGKLILLEMVQEKKYLDREVGNLNVNEENFNSKWEILTKSINEIKENINRFEKQVKLQIEISIRKRLQKRKKIKERKLNFKTFKQKCQEKINKKNETIDKLLSKAGEEVEGIKREAALKRQADSVLHEVRKKKYEGRKMLNLLSGLAKLRVLRSKEEEERGGYCSNKLTETFNQVMMRFQKLWENQIEVYKLEEKGLKIMLEENTLPYIKRPKFQSNLLQWEEVLFGGATNSSNTNISIENLIAVRRDWDWFVTRKSTAMSSGIPLGWVLPTGTQDEHWKMFSENPNALH